MPPVPPPPSDAATELATHADGEVGGGVDVAEPGVVQRRLAEDGAPLQ